MEEACTHLRYDQTNTCTDMLCVHSYKYTQRHVMQVLLTEGSGTVLGANFMNGYNMIFDTQQRRVGFAESDCKFEKVGLYISLSEVTLVM